MRHPKRYMRDGTATTRRVRGIAPVDCDNPAHARCFEALTSWAGDPNPHPDSHWHVYTSTRSGVVCLLGPFVGRETPQFQTGLKQRVENYLMRSAS